MIKFLLLKDSQLANDLMDSKDKASRYIVTSANLPLNKRQVLLFCHIWFVTFQHNISAAEMHPWGNVWCDLCNAVSKAESFYEVKY